MSNTVSGASLFTSEGVCAGHSDKACHAISGAVVDATLAQDPKGRVGLRLALATIRYENYKPDLHCEHIKKA